MARQPKPIANANLSDDAMAQTFSNLRTMVEDLDCGNDAISLLLPNGKPHAFESQMWDYKIKCPSMIVAPDDDMKKQYRAEIGDLIKDAVAFHNSYGGFIIFGIADKGGDRVCGSDQIFDSGDFNKRLEGYTGVNIECLFRIVPVSSHDENRNVGILLIPRRPSGSPPVRFKRKGPEKANGGRSFNEETYVRIRDECRPATAKSEDWLFLHSDRAPPKSLLRAKRPKIIASLPARDPDLIEFVGRQDTLSALRAWMLDARSPVRLVTGIGGLGKTTIAYRFAEEVVESGAGDVEWVIWLTAKRKTYSALMGQIVQATRVDFGSLEELYTAILKALSHQMELGDDEPTLDELADRVVDALFTYTCLIIVDDIDSLSPDEQKETVAALNGIALRTVGREIPPARILMTSRIDQGMAPTGVLKISGLDKNGFETYVKNLCSTFRIPQMGESTLQTLFSSTSGSPLFVASIVRLVRLGENLANAVENWRGQDGEEIRRFAFERELKRLDGPQGRLLYAVLLLGETSINDLAGILDATPKVVRDRISELQAYHLLSTATREGGDAVIFAPSDLSAVIEILRSHLQSQAKAVEQACARAQEMSNNDNRSIGAGIRRVVGAWDDGRAEDALVLARELRTRFQKSGDIANVLGQAFLKQSPPMSREADREFDSARQLGCSRPELIDDSISTKISLQDWQGLLAMTQNLTSNDRTRDAPLYGHLRARWELISIAKSRSDYGRIAELCLGAVDKISWKFSRMRLDKRQFEEFARLRFDFSRAYIDALGVTCVHAGDRLDVFEGVWHLAEHDVVLSDLVRVGMKALQSWWADVEQRPVIDLTACGILNRQLNRLDRLERQLSEYGRDHAPIISELSRVRLELAHRGANYLLLLNKLSGDHPPRDGHDPGGDRDGADRLQPASAVSGVGGALAPFSPSFRGARGEPGTGVRL